MVIKDLKYAESHEWVKVEASKPPASFGAVESIKATSDINTKLNDSPALVNASPYEDGCIIRVEINNGDELKILMDPDHYSKFCEEEDAKH
ncbi:hypothetical protein BUALT_Bualt18G0133900 [Buddleja alternifolia]|uniref:Glycine cleavage system H protein n=1 Tax=Buddleja alternifolia TaxID=168488 RepID=A0AAV6WFD2_9LAMI|nr:hypothetical protein BUALT_Bualt18G0133900 [Buddleja alternifolia]